jgi:hypothetical protein
LIRELVSLLEKIGLAWLSRVTTKEPTFLLLPAFWSFNMIAL